MLVLGLNAYHPDSSACIIKDGRLIAAVEEERFNRIKHWAGFPVESIRCCLKEAGVTLEEVDRIVLNRNPKTNLLKKANFVITNKPSAALIANRFFNVIRIQGIRDALVRNFSVSGGVISKKIDFVEHHRSHLASAFFVSPFQESTVVSIDGFGDFTSCMVAKGEGNTLKVLYEVNFPHSLGLLYTAFTQFLGFKSFGDEYKVMGLAAYGKPGNADKINDILLLLPDGRFALNPSYFTFHKTGQMEWNNCAPKMQDVFSGKFNEAFGKPRKYDEEILPFHCDLAASVQAAYEAVFFHIVNHAFKLTGITNLCLAGGCALNSLANGKIFDRTHFKEIFIQPASSDAGGALGAAYYLYHHLLKNKRAFVMRHTYWGPGYSEVEVEAEVEKKRKEFERMGCTIENIDNSDELCKKTAKCISEGKIVGWFQGRMEWGPRALGNRSILADPGRSEMKDILNARIKKREWFRPFAPSVLLENVGEWFKIGYPDPFMLKVYPIKEEKRKLIPAVTHVDGTGRLQTVSKEENPLYWKLIKEFENIKGTPLVLNTSFNENEPIVNRPQEALECFLRTKMDAVVLGNMLIRKSPDL